MLSTATRTLFGADQDAFRDPVQRFFEACDRSLQLHGGAGCMNEYPIARLWRDVRVNRIFGCTSEIMKEVVGRAL